MDSDVVLGYVKTILNWVLAFLPDSPFQMLNNSVIKPYLGYINWFIPVSAMLAEMELWLSAILIYYIYSLVLRWIRAIS